jgi:hypothetical protein
MSASGKKIKENFSFITIMNNSSQLIQKAYFILGFEVVLTDLLIAIKENPKKIMSKDFHQTGWTSCNITEPV